MSAKANDDLLRVVDVGNTNAVFGLFAGAELRRDFRVSTEAFRTADEYGALLLPLIQAGGLEANAVSAVMVGGGDGPAGGVFGVVAGFIGAQAVACAGGPTGAVGGGSLNGPGRGGGSGRRSRGCGRCGRAGR